MRLMLLSFTPCPCKSPRICSVKEPELSHSLSHPLAYSQNFLTSFTTPTAFSFPDSRGYFPGSIQFPFEDLKRKATLTTKPSLEMFCFSLNLVLCCRSQFHTCSLHQSVDCALWGHPLLPSWTEEQHGTVQMKDCRHRTHLTEYLPKFYRTIIQKCCRCHDVISWSMSKVPEGGHVVKEHSYWHHGSRGEMSKTSRGEMSTHFIAVLYPPSRDTNVFIVTILCSIIAHKHPDFILSLQRAELVFQEIASPVKVFCLPTKHRERTVLNINYHHNRNHTLKTHITFF